MRREPRRRGEGFLRGETVVQKDIVHLLWGLCPWEGGEGWLGTTVGEPFGRPKALGGGCQQKGGPVFVLGGLDCLEEPRLGGAGNFPHVRGVMFPGRSGSLVIFTTADSQVGGHQGLEELEGLDSGVCSLRRATRRFSDSDIHLSSYGGWGRTVRPEP